MVSTYRNNSGRKDALCSSPGSIAIDGVSLTVGELDDSKNTITVWLIPQTLELTNLGKKSPGDQVNIEVDILAKYVERLVNKTPAGDK